jgi:rod shape-determining protein MreC
MNKRIARVQGYFGLTRKIDSLRSELTLIQSKLPNTQYDAQGRTHIEGDSLMPKFELLEARVISNSINQRNNILILDRGRQHGVKRGMGVIFNAVEGVVGIVKNTSRHYSTVISLLNTQAHISASIKRNGFFGNLIWDLDDPRKMILEAIPKHAQLLKGDSVVTSGYSQVFPPGIFIGTVEDFSVRRGSNFYRINVQLSRDFSNVSHVYIIRDLFEEDLSVLKAREDAN